MLILRLIIAMDNNFKTNDAFNVRLTYILIFTVKCHIRQYNVECGDILMFEVTFKLLPLTFPAAPHGPAIRFINWVVVSLY